MNLKNKKISEQKNTPDVWLKCFPWPQIQGNKYDRGHAIIGGGETTSTGAAKIAAHCALRSGAGLVSVACDGATLATYAASFHAVMTKLVESSQEFSRLMEDKRIKAVLLGPGAGVTSRTEAYVLSALTQ